MCHFVICVAQNELVARGRKPTDAEAESVATRHPRLARFPVPLLQSWPLRKAFLPLALRFLRRYSAFLQLILQLILLWVLLWVLLWAWDQLRRLLWELVPQASRFLSSHQEDRRESPQLRSRDGCPIDGTDHFPVWSEFRLRPAKQNLKPFRAGRHRWILVFERSERLLFINRFNVATGFDRSILRL